MKFHTRHDNRTCDWLSFQSVKLLHKKEKNLNKIKKGKKRISPLVGARNLKIQLKTVSANLRKHLVADEKKSYTPLCNESNPKKLWNNLNKVLGREKENNIKGIFDNNGNITTEDYKITSIFNENLISSITDIVNQSPVNTNRIQFDPVMYDMLLDEIDEDEIRIIIQGLKKSSPGIDGIGTLIVKHLSSELSPLLCHMIKCIYETSIYPDCFKTALVVPINKSGDETAINDYRPVSMLTVFNKNVEKTLYKRIYDFVFFKAKFMYPRQFGFRARSGTETAALELAEQIKNMLDKKMKVSAVFMDIRKAFDFVNIECLLHTLNLSGIRGRTLKLVESYLRGRKQVVKINKQ